MKNLFRKLFPSKEMRAYNRMYRRHRKELVKHAKETRAWDWCWLHDSVIMQIRHMHEYYSAGNNVWQTDETRLPIVEQLQHILDLEEELNHLWDNHINGCIKNEDGSITFTEECTKSYVEIRNREQELYEEIYSYIGCHLREWWD